MRPAQFDAVRFLVTAVCFLLPLAPSVWAQPAGLKSGGTIAILPGVELAQLGEVEAAELQGEVERSIAKSIARAGHRALTSSQVRAALARHGKPGLCEQAIDCDRSALLGLLDLQALVVYRLWLQDGEPRELAIALTGAEHRGDASRELSTGQSLDTVTSNVFDAALADIAASNTVLVRIETDPPGAEVLVDRTLAGTAPGQFALRPGPHQVRVSVPGRVGVLDHFDVPVGATEHTVLLRLPSYTSSDVARSRSSEGWDSGPTPVVDYVVGTVAGVSALGMLVYGVATILDHNEECAMQDPDIPRCVLVSGPPPLTVGALAGAVVLGTGSALLFTLTPFTDAETLASGVALNGRF